MPASLPQVLSDTLDCLVALNRDRIQPKEAQAQLRFLQKRYPGTDIELLSGLSEKDLVVNGGQTLVADGQNVRIVSEGTSNDNH